MSATPATVTLGPVLTWSDRVNLIRCKVEILTLQADDYNWQCHVPVVVKAELEKTLLEIEELLK